MKELTPSAVLISATNEPVEVIYKAYRRCYASEAGTPESASYQQMCDFIKRMLKAEHTHDSPLEHVSITFHVTCSRAASHQFVRHRLASYSQQSQRYVSVKELPYITPSSFIGNKLKTTVFNVVLWTCELGYRILTKLGCKSEDARSVLPNATATHLAVTMNCRQLRHFFAERTCNRAQEEIRNIANQMLMYARVVVPVVFDDAGPHCMKSNHCPEPMPCGEQPWKNKKS